MTTKVNKVKAVTRFESEDGQTHHTREEAIRHNSSLRCMKNTKAIYSVSPTVQ